MLLLFIVVSPDWSEICHTRYKSWCEIDSHLQFMEGNVSMYICGQEQEAFRWLFYFGINIQNKFLTLDVTWYWQNAMVKLLFIVSECWVPEHFYLMVQYQPELHVFWIISNHVKVCVLFSYRLLSSSLFTCRTCGIHFEQQFCFHILPQHCQIFSLGMI